MNSHVGRCLRIVRRGAQHLSQARARDEERHRRGDGERHDGCHAARLAEEQRDIGTEKRAELPGVGRHRRAHRFGVRTEHDQAAVREQERKPEGQRELRVVPLPFGACDLQSRDPAQQPLVDHDADTEHDGAPEHRGDDRPHVRSEQRADAELGKDEQCSVHPEHEEFALGEVDDPHHAENQGEADAHQPVHAAQDETGVKGLQRVLDDDGDGGTHALASPGRTTIRPGTLPCSIRACTDAISSRGWTPEITGRTSPRAIKARVSSSCAREVLCTDSID